MKNLSQRGFLLFGVMLVVCAFVPSMASAASFFPLNTTHQLFSSDLSFAVTAGPIGAAGSICRASEFDSDIVSASVIEITSASFQNCMGTQNAVNCTATPVGTRFPWTATAPNTTNIQIHGIHIDVTFENTPGNATLCAANGATVTLTGTLTGGTWDSTRNELNFNAAPGLTAHFLGTGISSPATVAGTVRDTTSTLRILD